MFSFKRKQDNLCLGVKCIAIEHGIGKSKNLHIHPSGGPQCKDFRENGFLDFRFCYGNELNTHVSDPMGKHIRGDVLPRIAISGVGQWMHLLFRRSFFRGEKRADTER